MKAFKPYSLCPEAQRPLGIPLEWPWQESDCTEEQQAALEVEGFTVLSDEDYTDYKATLATDMATWQLTAPKRILPVTNQQLRQALIMTSIQTNNPTLHPEAILAFILSLPEPNKSLAKNYWEYSNEMQRDNTLVQALGPSLGLTSAQLDDMWVFASTLK